jgi:hypothetical protein
MPKCTGCNNEKPQADFITRLERVAKTCAVCRERGSARSKLHYNANKAKVDKRIKRWRAQNPDAYKRARKIVNKRFNKNNPDHVARKNERYRLKYPAKNAARTRAYQARKLKATPAWADKAAIEMLYELARLQRELTGESVHVEHIVPLKGKTVCGLHWEGNLRLTGGSYNSRKSNVSWPDMP